MCPNTNELFQEKAAKKKFLLEMVPRRQSGRLALKTQAREDEEIEDEIEREKEAEERKKEEEEMEKEREKLAEKRKSGKIFYDYGLLEISVP